MIFPVPVNGMESKRLLAYFQRTTSTLVPLVKRLKDSSITDRCRRPAGYAGPEVGHGAVHL